MDSSYKPVQLRVWSPCVVIISSMHNVSKDHSEHAL